MIGTGHFGSKRNKKRGKGIQGMLPGVKSEKQFSTRAVTLFCFGLFLCER